MLRTRVITAVVLLALLAGSAALGDKELQEMFALLVAAAMFEWMQLAGCGVALALTVGAVYGVALGLASAWDVRLSPHAGAVACLGASALWCTLAAVVVQARGLRIGRSASITLAFVLLTVAWIALDRLLQHGLLWLLSVLAVVWVADIAAYFTGRAFGRYKLAPHVSPGKTWEGVFGAIVAVTLVALTVRVLWPRADVWSNQLLVLAWPLALAAMWAVVALSIVGDLFESLLKRQAQVKDSGRLLPGHGGVLDRIDATLPALPAAVLIEWWTR
ncbi:MAG: phosphatidate cytidylyltransferase [Burkholderiaceae bacterium]|nr:phosphatidate cytidylyltransferase [Burkholderiaceae bacterium]